MRIAFATQTYPPMVNGVSFVVERMARNMASRGHQVMVLTASDRGPAYEITSGNLRILRLTSLKNPLRAAQRFPMFPTAAGLRALSTFQPDLIHSHDLLQLNPSALMYSRQTGIPALISTHAVPWIITRNLPAFMAGARGRLEHSLWCYARWLLRQFTYAISPTRTISDLVAANTGIRPLVISNGMDLDLFAPTRPARQQEASIRDRLGIPPRVPIILHVGQLHIGKRIDRVIQAAAPAIRRLDAHLLIVGDGPDKSRLKEMCASAGILEHTHFPGIITLDDGLPGVYQISSLFVTASEIETQSLVLLEAAASGLPIAAVNATCIPEIVHEGVNGFLAQPDDIAGLASAIQRILEHPSLARSMGERSRVIAQNHDIRKTFDAYEGLYRDTIDALLESPVGKPANPASEVAERMLDLP